MDNSTDVKKETSSSDEKQDFRNIIMAESLYYLALTLAGLYTFLTILHLVLQPPPLVYILSASSFLSTLIYLSCAWVFHRWPISPDWGHTAGTLLAIVVLFNSFLHLALTIQPQEFINISFLIIAVGFFFFSTPWLVGFIVVGLAGWGVFALYAGLGGIWINYGIFLLQAVFISLLMHAIRLHKTEEALQHSQHRMETIVKTAQDGIFALDEQGIIESANPAAESMFGFTSGKLVGQDLGSLLTPEHRKHIMALYKRKNSSDRFGNERLLFELTAKRINGEVFPLELCLNEMWLENRQLYCGVARDITERKKAEAALRESEKRIQDFLDNASDLIQSVAPDGRFLYVNDTWKNTLGYDTHDLKTLTLMDIIAPETPAETRDKLMAMLEGAPVDRLEITLITKFGRRIIVAGSSNSRFENDELIASQGIFHDITAQKTAQEQLHAAMLEAEATNRAKSEFLANVSHELRTPLNSIIGFANLLKKNKYGSLQEQDLLYVDRIVKNGVHLLNLINDVLDLSKIESGRMELRLEEIHIGELINETVEQMEGQTREHNVELKVEYPNGIEPVTTDPAKLKQVLINLIGNAIKFTEEGSVFIRVEKDEQENIPTRIDVIDTGVGIPLDKLEYIFGAFNQGDGAATRRYSGAGLGLAISRSMCMRMGYRLEAFSQPGEGSTFSIYM